MATLANTIAGNRAQGRDEIATPLPRAVAVASRSQRTARQARAKFAYRILQAGAQALRRTISVLTLLVPLSYFTFALLASGVLRQDLILGSVRTVMEAMVLPVRAVAARIFAVPMVFHGLDLVLVGWGLIALVLREVVLEPFRKLETWSEDKLQMSIGGLSRRRRVACPFPQPRHS